jgi:hypothetical protein
MLKAVSAAFAAVARFLVDVVTAYGDACESDSKNGYWTWGE